MDFRFRSAFRSMRAGPSAGRWSGKHPRLPIGQTIRRCSTRERRSLAMSESVLEALEQFFDALPSCVRHDLSFMMVMLSDEGLVIGDGGADYETAARSLFAARTHVGRVADLINAVSIFDVYFAMNARRRFDLTQSKLRQAWPHDGPTSVSLVLARYADEVE